MERGPQKWSRHIPLRLPRGPCRQTECLELCQAYYILTALQGGRRYLSLLFLYVLFFFFLAALGLSASTQDPRSSLQHAVSLGCHANS